MAAVGREPPIGIVSDLTVLDPHQPVEPLEADIQEIIGLSITASFYERHE